MSTQPDVEIYVKDADAQQVHAWLQQQFSQCSPWQQSGNISRCNCDGIKVTWYAKAVGSWHSLLFDSPSTPWANDKACAVAAFDALGVEIRCAPSGWLEQQGEADAERWLKINSQGSQEFIWRT